MAGKPTARTKKKPPQKPAVARRPQSAKPSNRARPTTTPTAMRARGAGEFSLERLHQVALTATSLDASIVFYRDVLGLRFIARFDPPGIAFFALGGGTRLMLSASSSQATLYFLVEDVDSAVKELRKRNVQFLHAPAMVHRDESGQFGKKGVEEWMAFFKDPGGNLVGLVERRQ